MISDAGWGHAGHEPAARGQADGKPRLSVSLGLWQDRPAGEVVRTAEVADALGYGEIWIGEMATFDAFALGAVVCFTIHRLNTARLAERPWLREGEPARAA